MAFPHAFLLKELTQKTELVYKIYIDRDILRMFDSKMLILVRESIPRQVDKKSGGPQGERGLEFSRRRKGQTFFPLHSLGLYNSNVHCLRTVSGKNLLANPVIL